MIEYYEALDGINQGIDPEVLKGKLESARRDIDLAIHSLPKKLYVALRNDIDRVLTLLDTGLERFAT